MSEPGAGAPAPLRRPVPLGPGGRPLRGLRVVPALLLPAAIAVNGVVMLSDRAPGLLRRLSSRIDAGVARAAAAGAPQAVSDARVPQSDFPVHVLVWAAAALLVGLAAWSWLSLLLGAAGVFTVSVAVEVAQGLLSATRTVQSADVAANALGVAAGAVAVAAFALFWRLGHPVADGPERGLA